MAVEEVSAAKIEILRGCVLQVTPAIVQIEPFSVERLLATLPRKYQCSLPHEHSNEYRSLEREMVEVDPEDPRNFLSAQCVFPIVAPWTMHRVVGIGLFSESTEVEMAATCRVAHDVPSHLLQGKDVVRVVCTQSVNSEHAEELDDRETNIAGHFGYSFPACGLLSEEPVIRPTSSASKHSAVLEKLRSDMMAVGIHLTSKNILEEKENGTSLCAFTTGGGKPMKNPALASVFGLGTANHQVEQSSLDDRKPILRVKLDAQHDALVCEPLETPEPSDGQPLVKKCTLSIKKRQSLFPLAPPKKLKGGKKGAEKEAPKKKQGALGEGAVKKTNIAGPASDPSDAAYGPASDPSASAAPRAAKKRPDVSEIDPRKISAEYLKPLNLESLKAHLRTMKDSAGKALKLGGKKDELIARIIENTEVPTVSEAAAAIADAPGGAPELEFDMKIDEVVGASAAAEEMEFDFDDSDDEIKLP